MFFILKKKDTGFKSLALNCLEINQLPKKKDFSDKTC